MMSGLLPWVYPYNSVRCTYQTFYTFFQLNHSLLSLSSFLCLALLSGDFRVLCHLFFFS